MSTTTSSAAADYAPIAQRIRHQSAQLSALLADRIYIDHRFAEPIDFHSTWQSQPPTASLAVADQLLQFSAFDALDAQLESMCRLTSAPAQVAAASAATAAGFSSSAGASKPGPPKRGVGGIGGIQRQVSLRRQQSVQSMLSSRENLSASVTVVGAEPAAAPVEPAAVAEPMVAADTIREFNAAAGAVSGSDLDVEALCDGDKQRFRPFFKVVPRLREFVAQVQRVVEQNRGQVEEGGGAGMSEADGNELGDLLQRLQQLVADVAYLTDHPNIYDLNKVPPLDDPVQECLEELYKQIMNQ